MIFHSDQHQSKTEERKEKLISCPNKSNNINNATRNATFLEFLRTRKRKEKNFLALND